MDEIIKRIHELATKVNAASIDTKVKEEILNALDRAYDAALKAR